MTAHDLLGSAEKRTTSVWWPVAIDRRLDLLHRLARDAGEQTSRAQILAALVAEAPLDGEGLGVLIRNYRRSRLDAFEAATGPEQERVRQPGPRPASSEPRR